MPAGEPFALLAAVSLLSLAAHIALIAAGAFRSAPRRAAPFMVAAGFVLAGTAAVSGVRVGLPEPSALGLARAIGMALLAAALLLARPTGSARKLGIVVLAGGALGACTPLVDSGALDTTLLICRAIGSTALLYL